MTSAPCTTALAAGYEHSCAIRTDGHVACWGEQDATQSTPSGERHGFAQVKVSAAGSFMCVIGGETVTKPSWTAALACVARTLYVRAPGSAARPRNP